MSIIKITKQDYFNHSGIQLDLDFMGGEADDGTAGVDRLLNNISLEVWDYLQARYIFDSKKFLEMANSNEEIAKKYKRALCYQLDYVRKSGDGRTNIHLGINDLAPKAFDIFKTLGLTNIQLPSDIYRRNW